MKTLGVSYLRILAQKIKDFFSSWVIVWNAKVV